MSSELTQSENEYRRSTERWENEGGHWVRGLSMEKMNDQKHWGTNEFEVIPPLDAHTYQISASRPTLLNSTYFMKLWNAGTRTAKTDRLSARRHRLSINSANHPATRPFAER